MPAPRNIKVVRDDVARVLKDFNRLAEKRVLVGVPADTAEDRQPEEGEKGPLNNAEIGYLMENGSPEANIPARPWLKPGVATADEKVAKAYETGVKALLDHQVENLDATHAKAGMAAQSAIRGYIRKGGSFAPLAPATLERRKARGRTGEKPLIDTGQFLKAINWVIRKTPKKGA